MPRVYKRKENARPIKQYTDEALQKCLTEVLDDKLSVGKASRKYGIPKGTLINKIHGQRIKKHGGQTAFTETEENNIIEGLLASTKWGLPLNALDLRLTAKAYLDRLGNDSRFRNNLPGPDWAKGFLERHKQQLSERMDNNIKRASAAVNSEMFTDFLNELSKTLEGSTCKTNFGGCHTKGSSSRQRSDEEGSSWQSNLVPSTLLDSKSPNDERDSFLPEDMSENSMEISSPRSDPLELKFAQPSTTDFFLPSNSADTEEETSFVDNPSQPLGVINDAYTKFFLSMADTVRDLPPDLQIIAKRNVLHEVTECELTALSRCNSSKN